MMICIKYRSILHKKCNKYNAKMIFQSGVGPAVFMSCRLSVHRKEETKSRSAGYCGRAIRKCRFATTLLHLRTNLIR